MMTPLTIKEQLQGIIRQEAPKGGEHGAPRDVNKRKRVEGMAFGTPQGRGARIVDDSFELSGRNYKEGINKKYLGEKYPKLCKMPTKEETSRRDGLQNTTRKRRRAHKYGRSQQHTHP